MKLLSFGEVLFDIFENDALIGGAPLNFAAHAAVLGLDAYLMSAVGDDEYGIKALSEIDGLGVKCDFVKTLQEWETGKCIVTLDEHAIPSYNLLDNVAYDHIPYSEELGEMDVFAFGTLALRGGENRRTVEKILKNNFSYVYSDLNIRPPFYSEDSVCFCFENATIVKISDEELPIITRLMFERELNLKDAINALAKKFTNLDVIIITCGADGAYAWKKGEDGLHFLMSVKTQEVSTVGAGDSFGAAFLSEYIKSGDIDMALSLAAKVSAFVVSQKGAVPAGTKEFVENLT